MRRLNKNKSLVSLIHKNRLRTIHGIFEKYISESEISWADFGCSNGFIPEEIMKTNRFKFSKIVGFDYVERLLELARAKRISNAEFKYFDMNEVINDVEDHFDLFTCFETHGTCGQYQNCND